MSEKGIGDFWRIAIEFPAEWLALAHEIAAEPDVEV